jgi:hypothetical protein
MNDASHSSSTDETARKTKTESTGRVKAAAWTAGLTAFFAIAMISDSPTWPAAFVAGCVIAMVAFVCYLILHYR